MGIQYVDRTVNPIRARHKTTGRCGHFCIKVSSGCTHCYSSEWQGFRGTGVPFEARHADEVEVYFEPRVFREVLRRRTPTRWFWCDMTDFWGAWVREEWIDKMFAVMVLTPQHTHLWTTKRPERMRHYLSAPDVGLRWLAAIMGYREFDRWAYQESDAERWSKSGAPNVHLGVSVENQATANERIPLLLQTPASVRWVSYEPALGPVDFAKFLPHGLGWLVIGGESGPGARPFNLTWARETIAQCRKAGVSVFVKQLGSRPYLSVLVEGETGPAPLEWSGDGLGTARLRLRDRKGGDASEWPKDLCVREWPR